MFYSIIFGLISAASASSSCFLLGNAAEPFSTSEVSTMRSFFMKNINIEGKGGVAAAPSYATTPAGSYYYHWMRDAGLVMRSLQETSGGLSEYETILKSYATWVLHTQSESDPNGIDVRTEPKFELPNGEPYTGMQHKLNVTVCAITVHI